MTLRTIRSGAAFVTRDPETGQDVTLYGGEQLELGDDVAAAHADKLEPLPAEAVQTPAPEGDA
jgi:hypothetical protein